MIDLAFEPCDASRLSCKIVLSPVTPLQPSLLLSCLSLASLSPLCFSRTMNVYEVISHGHVTVRALHTPYLLVPIQNFCIFVTPSPSCTSKTPSLHPCSTLAPLWSTYCTHRRRLTTGLVLNPCVAPTHPFFHSQKLQGLRLRLPKDSRNLFDDIPFQ
jgi:hypothetical protein